MFLESTSFLKKRSKKLLRLKKTTSHSRVSRTKSFLVLFFKKELPCLVFLALLAAPFAPASASWWNGEWQYRLKIDADTGPKGANIGERIGRTQVLVRLLANNFKFDSAKPDGSDLRFIGADDKTPLHYHIEKWDGPRR